MTQDISNLWTRATSASALQEAWYHVKANRGSAGGDHVSLSEFEKDLFANLTQLRAELLSGTYRSGPIRKVSVPKKKPGYRILSIPTIRDRVLHTSLTKTLVPILEPMFEDGSFAYRPNRGVTHAVERIEQWHRRGYDIVIEADIVSFFDNINHTLLLEKLQNALAQLDGSAPVLTLIANILKEQGRFLNTPNQGVLQGSPLSPLLSNLYLDALDEEIERQGVKIVRFADDFVILCKSVKKAKRTLQHCVEVLNDHNLKLHDEGTRIVNFEQGFDFIGYLFLRTLALKETKPKTSLTTKPIKSEVDDEGVIQLGENNTRFDPGKRVLYLLDPDHCFSTRNKSFSICQDDGTELIAIPYKRVGRIEIGPKVTCSKQPLDLALHNSIDVAFLDHFGQTRGILASQGPKRAGLHLAQASSILNSEHRNAIASKIVNARIRNQRCQLYRLKRNKNHTDLEHILDRMKQNYRKINKSLTPSQLLGIEGSTTALYWPALFSLLTPPSMMPKKRTRPAQDPLNAVINYLCGILERDIRAAVQASGLHQGFAFLHATKDKHDGLVYDMMEPFRAPLTEGLSIYLFNSKRLKKDMFQYLEHGEIELNTNARDVLITNYENFASKRVNRPDGKGKLAWRAMMQQQANSLKEAITKQNSSHFYPYLMEP